MGVVLNPPVGGMTPRGRVTQRAVRRVRVVMSRIFPIIVSRGINPLIGRRVRRRGGSRDTEIRSLTLIRPRSQKLFPRLR